MTQTTRPNAIDLVWVSPAGPLGIGLCDEGLASITFLPTGTRRRRLPRRGMAAAVVEQLAAYFDDPGSTFELPLILAGTPFQQGVWERLRTIPAGSVRTYGQLARALGTSPRAIGAACRANPCPVVVPCHRVVSAAGWGGFMGARDVACLEIKRWLLAHEGITRL